MEEPWLLLSLEILPSNIVWWLPPTRNEALMSINAVDALIHQIKKDNSQVNLTKKEELLRMAIKANDAR